MLTSKLMCLYFRPSHRMKLEVCTTLILCHTKKRIDCEHRVANIFTISYCISPGCASDTHMFTLVILLG